MLDLSAIVKQLGATLGFGQQDRLRLTAAGSLAVAQAENLHTDRARHRLRYHGGTQVIASGIAPVTAIPTTTATLALHNLDLEKSLVIDRLAFFLGSGTPTAGATLMAAVSPNKPATPSAAANYSAVCTRAGGPASAARWATGQTWEAGAAWVAVLSTFQLAAANVGQGDAAANLGGSLIIPPGFQLGLAILSGTGTSPLYGVSAEWDEIKLPAE